MNYIYEKIKKIIEFLKKVPFLPLGFFMIFYIVYIRAIMERLPSTLHQNLYLNENYYKILLYVFFICLNLHSIITNIKIIYKIPIKRNKFLTKFLTKYAKFSHNSYEAVDYFIKNIMFPNEIGEWMASVGVFLWKHFYGRRNYFILTLLAFPRIIVLLAFCIDIFVFHEFNYVYKFSILLLIPPIIDYIQYLLDKFWKENKPILEGILFFYNNTTQKRVWIKEILFAEMHMKKYQYIYTDDLVYGLTNEYVEAQKGLQWNVEKTIAHFYSLFYDVLLPIALYSLQYTTFYKPRTLPIITIIIDTVYLITWIYILVYSW